MNNNSQHIDEKMLLRYLLGEASTDEMKQVRDWLKLSEKNQKLLDDYEAIWMEAGKLIPNPVAVDSQSAWERMSERVDKYEAQKAKNDDLEIKEAENKSKAISLKYRITWLSTSAAAIIVIFWGIYQLLLKPDVTIQNIKIASVEEVINDTLPDGSQISLNLNSKITYPEKFAENERRIALEGEAFFNVEHNKEKPFIIEANNVFVKVLGTSFNIKAYKNSEVEVFVRHGLVKLFVVDAESMDTSAILLKAGETGKISTKEKKPVYVTEQIPDALFWKSYTLIFNDTDLKKVFSLLENYYNIKIKVNDKQIYNCKLSTTFSNNTIDEIIEVIAATFGFEFTKEKNIFTIKGNGCSEKNI
jgi:ferric-dicitrate binding protein FerR (iron transport regulator)